MHVIGLSYDFHDGAAALVTDGELVGVAAEERLSLQKHDSSFPSLAISALLNAHNLKPEAVDEVAYYEQPGAKYARILTTSFARFPRGGGNFIAANKGWLRDRLWVRGALSSHFGISPRRVHMLPHHQSHIAQAFLASPFDDAAVLVLDGVGEWDCTTLAVADSRTPQGLRAVEQYEYPHSIGLVYAAFTAYLGFKPNSGEASTMALSAFGTSRYLEQMRRVIRPCPDGTYSIDPAYFNFEDNASELFSARMVATFGPPRDIRQPYLYDALRDTQQTIPAEDSRCADIAASLQEVLAEVLLGLSKRLKQHTESKNLCLAGGVALNCLANSRLVQESGFERFFIPPDPGDGGASFGAAMLRAAEHTKVKPLEHPYLGHSRGLEEIRPIFRACPDLSVLLGKQINGARAAARIDVSMIDDESQLLDSVVEDLSRGNIVAWMQGNFEVGPRALGNRSLLVDPGQLDAVRRMSHTVKSHTHFRPYALSIAEDDAALVLDSTWISQPVMKWMQTIWNVRDEYRSRLRGAMHADGSTRPQVCSAADNPRYWALLKRFGRFSGVSALLNTSLNERSLPMVAHARMALAMFARTGIDTLVIDNCVMRKRY